MSTLRAATLVLLPTLTLGAVVLTGTAKPLRAAARALPTARVAGVMFNQPVADAQDGMPSLAFQGTFAQTKLALIIENAAGGIIGYDKEASKVTQFSDDAGRSLLKENGAFGPFTFGERIVNDGKGLVLELESEMSPSAEATSVSASGTIAVQLAEEKRTYATPMTLLNDGTALHAGPIHMTVKGLKKSDWNDDYELELETKYAVDMLVSYTATLADGTRVPLTRRSTFSFGSSTTMSLACEAELSGQVSLELETWHKPVVRQVPFRVEAAVRLR